MTTLVPYIANVITPTTLVPGASNIVATFAIPSSVVTGSDILLFCWNVNAGANSGMGSGWTFSGGSGATWSTGGAAGSPFIQNAASSGLSVATQWRTVATGDAGATITATFPFGAYSGNGIILVLRNCNTATPFPDFKTINGGFASGSSVSSSNNLLVVTGVEDLVLELWSAGLSSSATVTPSLTPPDYLVGTWSGQNSSGHAGSTLRITARQSIGSNAQTMVSDNAIVTSAGNTPQVACVQIAVQAAAGPIAPTITSNVAPTSSVVTSTTVTMTFTVPGGITTDQVLVLAFAADNRGNNSTWPILSASGGGASAGVWSTFSFIDPSSTQDMIGGIFFRPAVSGDSGTTITLVFTNSSGGANNIAAGAQLFVVSYWNSALSGIDTANRLTSSGGTATAVSGSVTHPHQNVLQMFFMEPWGGTPTFTVGSSAAAQVGALQRPLFGDGTTGSTFAVTQETIHALTTHFGSGESYATGSAWSLAVAVGLYPPVPSSPTLGAPANNGYVDMSGTPAFNWTHNYSSVGQGPQSSYSFRRRLTSATSYEFWDATTGAFVPYPVWNVTTAQGITFPSGVWANGNVYNWSVATQDSLTSQLSDFAADSVLVAQAAPVVVVNAPSGVVQISFPTVSWTTTPAPSTVQTGWRVIIYSAAQYSVTGFAPGVSPGYADSGTVSGTASSYAVPSAVQLPNNTAYRAYVMAWESGNEGSAWAFSAFTLAVDSPALPSLTATPGNDPVTGAPMVTLTAQGSDNLLSTDDGSFEGGIGTFVGANCALASSTAVTPPDGSHSLRLTANSAATMKATSGFYAVLPSTQYSAVAWVRTAATARSTSVGMAWYDSSHNPISTTTSTASNDSTVFAARNVTATSPASAAFVEIVLTVTTPANSEVHYFDQVGIRPGADPTWFRGGLVGLTSADIRFSDDNGVTWTTVRNASALPVAAISEQASVIDYESPLGVSRQYQVQMFANIAGLITSAWSSAASAAAPVGVLYWLKDPLDTTAAMEFNQKVNPVSQQAEKATVKVLMGRARVVVVSDGLLGIDGIIDTGVLGAAQYEALIALMRSMNTLLLQTPFGEQWYVRLGVSQTGQAYRVVTRQLDTVANPYTELQIPFVEVDVP